MAWIALRTLWRGARMNAHNTYRCCYHFYLHHSPLAPLQPHSRKQFRGSTACIRACNANLEANADIYRIIYPSSPTDNERPSTIPHTSQHAHFNKHPTCRPPARHINLRTAQQHHNPSLEHHSSRRHQWQFSAPMLAARPFRNQHYSRHSRRSISQPRKCHQCYVPNHPR